MAWSAVGPLRKDRCLGVKDLNNQWLYEHDVVTCKEQAGAWLVVHFSNQWALVNKTPCSVPTLIDSSKESDSSSPKLRASDEVDVPHQLLFVSAADGNFQVANFDSVLECVNVLNLIQIHHEVAAHSNETVGRQFV